MKRKSTPKKLKPVRKPGTRTFAECMGPLIDSTMALGAAVRAMQQRDALFELGAREQCEQLLFGPPGTPLKPGDLVVLTATACRIWATVMGLPVTRSLTAVWTVTACDCDLCTHGSFVCTNEQISPELGYVSNDNAGTTALRHISVGQLKRKGELRADDGLSSGPAQPSLGDAVQRAARRGVR